MSICRQWSLVKHLPRATLAKTLKCRSWNCPTCRPTRKAQLLARALSGSPTKFLTLTVNPRVLLTPEERLTLLSRCWKILVKRLRRRFPETAIEYLVVVESTKRGEPHLHILASLPFVSQAYLSSAMSELADSPIVDIRSIKKRGHIIRYVAKYIAKAPHHFGSHKRYWFSGNYEENRAENPRHDGLEDYAWAVSRNQLAQIVAEWTFLGFDIHRQDDDFYIGIATSAHNRGPP